MAKLKFFIISLGVGILVSLSFSANLFQGFEKFTQDLFVSSHPVSPDIVILEIDSNSINKLGQWPWTRETFAKIFSKLDLVSPKSVGLDVMLSESSSRGLKDDLILKVAFDKINYPVVFPVEIGDLRVVKGKPNQGEDILKPLALFNDTKNAHLAHVNLIQDFDSVVRTFPLEIGAFKQFSSEVLRLGGKEIDFSGFETNPHIVYSGPTGSIRRVPVSRLFEDSVDLNIFKDKLVLLGATSPDLHDDRLTPFSRGTAMPGIEIQANILNMLLQGYSAKEAGVGLTILWIFGATLISALIFAFSKKILWPIGLNVLIGIAYSALVVYFFDKGIIFNFLHINLSWIFATLALFAYRYFYGEREKEEIRKLFSKYVSPKVLQDILKDPKSVKLGGEEREVTVFFSDIRSFTTMSEKTKPKELVRILNKYFTAMTHEVLEHGGVVDKYIGDAIMAFWGAPIDDANQADNAFEASLDMLQELKKLNRELVEAGDPEINIGIGLYTGKAIVGNVGSDLRFDYTVMGDTVNVASRLEGLNKEYKTNIIIGESTKNKIRGNHNFKYLGEAAVKGRKEPVRIYTIEI